MIPVPVAYENGYKLTPGSSSATVCVVPVIVDEENHTARLGMTWNEIMATEKAGRPCYMFLASNSESGFAIEPFLLGARTHTNGDTTKYLVYSLPDKDRGFIADNPTDYPHGNLQ